MFLAFSACKKDDEIKATNVPVITNGPAATSEVHSTATTELTLKITRMPHTKENPYYGSIVSDDPVSVPFFDDGGDPDSLEGVPQSIGDTTRIAWQFVATTDFDYISTYMCTWGNSGSATTFSIFKWDNDYDTTIEGKPLYNTKMEDIVDNDPLNFVFENPLPPAEYVLVIEENFGTEIGIWEVSIDDTEEYVYARLYIDDVDIPTKLPNAEIHYVNTPEISFLKVSDLY